MERMNGTSQMYTGQDISTTRADLVAMTARLVTAFVAKNAVEADALPAMIASVHQTLCDLERGGATAAPIADPAVPVSKSVTQDHIICLEDGRKLKMLKRYLRSRYDMSPEDYRARWNLPHDYPMVAPSYARRRSEFAKQIGLGRKRGET